MAKTDTSQWDTTASNNLDIGGVNIAEGCPAANMNNALREVMKQIAAARTGSDTGIVTGTPGTDGQFATWNADGDIVGSDGQSDATLASIAALGTAADKGLYTTGVDTWAEFALSASARGMLAAAGTVANKAVYSTGSGVWAEYDISAAGRALLDDASASAQRTTLGLGTAAVLNAGTSANNLVQLNASGEINSSLLSSVGVGQTWQDVSGSRSAGTSYQNTTSKPIMVAITGGGSIERTLQASTNGSTWVTVATIEANEEHTFSLIVPPDHYYRVSGAITVTTWAELR